MGSSQHPDKDRSPKRKLPPAHVKTKQQKTHTRKNKNDLDLCLSECHIYHVRPIDNVFEEGPEKVQRRLEDFNKDLSLTLGKNKPQSIHEQLKEFENKQGGLATRKDRFDEAISEFEAAFPEETQPKEDDSEEF